MTWPPTKASVISFWSSGSLTVASVYGFYIKQNPGVFEIEFNLVNVFENLIYIIIYTIYIFICMIDYDCMYIMYMTHYPGLQVQ